MFKKKSNYKFLNNYVKRIEYKGYMSYILCFGIECINRPNKKTSFCKLKFICLNKDLILKKIKPYLNEFIHMYFLLYSIYFWDIQSNKFRVRLKLGVFSNSNVLKMCPVVNPKVWVRLKLGCGLN